MKGPARRAIGKTIVLYFLEDFRGLVDKTSKFYQEAGVIKTAFRLAAGTFRPLPEAGTRKKPDRAAAVMLKIYNSLTRDKQDFVPITPGKVRLYVCGMT